MKQWIKIERIPGPLASAYDKATRMVIDTYYRQVAEEVVSRRDKGVILDLGTGPGYLPIQIVKRAPELKVVGVDLSRKLIQLAKANARIAGLSDQLTFEVGNSASLRFNDGCFDMVISTGMFHSLKKPISVIQEMHRVLKNGGEAWIYDPAKVASQVDRKKWKASLTPRERFFLWLFKRLGLHKPITTYTRNQVIPIVKATDFERYRIEERENEIRIKLWK